MYDYLLKLLSSFACKGTDYAVLVFSNLWSICLHDTFLECSFMNFDTRSIRGEMLCFEMFFWSCVSQKFSKKRYNSTLESSPYHEISWLSKLHFFLSGKCIWYLVMWWMKAFVIVWYVTSKFRSVIITCNKFRTYVWQGLVKLQIIKLFKQIASYFFCTQQSI